MSNLHGLIFDIRKFSLHDGPGIRTTVFFKGCPLSCWWCHNPESQSSAPEMMLWDSRCIRCGSCVSTCSVEAISPVENSTGVCFKTDRDVCTVCGSCVSACVSDARELVGKCMDVDEVMQAIQRDAHFFEDSQGGVTFSGGEPLVQRAFLAELLQRCKVLDIHTAVDTSGYTPWKALDSIRADTDLFLFDLKMMEDSRHRKYTGVPNGLILHNLRSLSEHGERIIIRVPIIPGVNDDDENLQAVGQFCAELPHLERVDILAYHHSAVGKYKRLNRPYLLPDTRPPSPERMEEIAHLLEKKNLIVKIGG